MLHTLLFVLTYFSGVILAFVSNPAFAFVLYEMVYFFFPDNRWWGYMLPDLSYSFYTVILMVVLLLVNFKESSKNKILAMPQFKWLFLVSVCFAVASFFSVFPIVHNQFLKNYLTMVGIICIAYKLIDTDKKLNIVIWGYISGVWYMGFYIYQMGRNSGDRVEGMGTVDAITSNGLAAAIAPSLVLCLYYYWRFNEKHLKLLFVVAGIFTANAIVLINSRGAFLAVTCSLAYFMYFLFFSSMQKKFQKATVIWLIVAGLGGVVYLADDSFLDRMSTITQSTAVNTEQETAATRTVFWAAAWKMAQDHPLGVGTNGFEYYAPFYIPENVHTGRSRNRAVHSSWFEALSEIGYLGLFALVMVFISSFKGTKKCKELFRARKDIDQYFKIIAIEAALISFMVSMVFINRFKAEVLYWLILYAACAYNIYVVKESKDVSTNKTSNNR